MTHNIKEQELRKMYYQEQMTQIDIAKRLGCSLATIFRAFKKFNLDGRNSGEATLAKLGKNVVFERLRNLANAKKIFIPKREFVSLYPKMTLKELSIHFKCGQTLIWKKVREFGLSPIRREIRLIHKQKSPEHRLALSVSAINRNMNNENNPNWKGGVAFEIYKQRLSTNYKNWRKLILIKYEYKCQNCGKDNNDICNHCKHQVKLHVHHIKSFSKHPELRFDLCNGTVLCDSCHRLAHSSKRGELGGKPERSIPSEAVEIQNV